MIIEAKQAEEQAVMRVADLMCAAARTAPKACGIDHLETAIVTGEEKAQISEAMRTICGNDPGNFMARDADNLDHASALVLIGAVYGVRGLGKPCSLCGYEGCDVSRKNDGQCVFDLLDMGIAIGSAVAVAADHRIDNRIMYSIGKGVQALGMMPECGIVMGIPLSVSGKSPFYDRKKSK